MICPKMALAYTSLVRKVAGIRHECIWDLRRVREEDRHC